MGDTSVPTYTPDADTTSYVNNCTQLVLRSKPGHIQLSFTDSDRMDGQTDDYPSFDVAHPGMPNVADTGWGNSGAKGINVRTMKPFTVSPTG